MDNEINLVVSSKVKEKRFSNYIPIWKFVLFSLISFGIYELYWTYKNWKLIKEKLLINISPIARAIFGYFYIYSFSKYILGLAKEKGYKESYSSGWVAFGFIALSLLWRLPDPYWLVSIFSFVPLIFIVKALNFYCSIEQPDHKIRTGLSVGEVVFVIFFGIFFILSLIGSFLP